MRLHMIVLLSLTLLVAGCSMDLPWFPHDNEEYVISGRVVDQYGSGVGNVSVFTDTGLHDTTARNGTFLFTQLKGTVTLTPQREGYAFSPSQIVVHRERTNIEFVMHPEGEEPPEPKYSIGGRVVDPRGDGVGGVTVSAQNKETTTASNGQWQLDDIRGEVV